MDIDSWMHRGRLAGTVVLGFLALAAMPRSSDAAEIVAAISPTELPRDLAVLAVDAETPSWVEAAHSTQHEVLLDGARDDKPATVIDFVVNSRRPMRLEVLDLEGHLVRTIAEGRWAVGHHQLAWQHDTESGEIAEANRYIVRLSPSITRTEAAAPSLAR